MTTPIRTCTALNAQGEPCQMKPLAGGEHCWAHAPERGAARALARKRGGQRAGARFRAPASEPPGEVDVTSVPGIQEVVRVAVVDTMRQPNNASRSRALAQLAGTALRALEVGELESRLEQIERVIESQIGRVQQWRGTTGYGH